MKSNRAFENIIHGVFLLLGLITVGCVLLITVYLVISGIPAIREIGLIPFLLGTKWASTAAEPSYGIPPFILTSVYGTAGAILLAVIIVMGGILAGAGIALCFSQGGSTGGTDIAAMIINKYRTISYGKIVIYSDFVIIGSSMLVGFHIDTVIYGYVMTAVFGYTVDMIMAGNQQSSQVFIVTHDYEKMAQAIVDNIHRGVTLIDSQGWYTKKESKIVMVVCRKRETTMILKFVKTIDPEAFMTVGSVMGVYGKGFQAISKP